MLCASGAVLWKMVKLPLPLGIPLDSEFVIANQVLFLFVAKMRLTTMRKSTLNARRIATHHTPSKTPRTPIRKATRRSREDGASQGIITRSAATRIVGSLAAADLIRLPKKLFSPRGGVYPLQCLRGPITPVAAFGHLSTYWSDVSSSTRPPVRSQTSHFGQLAHFPRHPSAAHSGNEWNATCFYLRLRVMEVLMVA